MPTPEVTASYEQLRSMTTSILQQARRHPVSLRRLQHETAKSVDSRRTARLVSLLQDLVSSGAVTLVSEGADPEYYWTANLAGLKERLCAILKSHHTRYPQEPGMSVGEIKRRFSETQTLNAKKNIDLRLFEMTVAGCKSAGLVVDADCGLRLAGFAPRSEDDPETRLLEAKIRAHVRNRLCARIEAEELSRALHVDVRTLKVVVTRMVKAGALIRLARLYPVREDRYLEASVVEQAKALLSAALTRQPQLSTSELRGVLGWTRSTTIPLLEYLDSIGFTRREGDFRRLARPVVPQRSERPASREGVPTPQA